MKKSISFNTIKILIVVILLVGTITACTDKNVENVNLKLGTYALLNKKVELTSTLELSKNNQFIFTVSPISSYLGVGTYNIKGDKLTCKTDDGEYTLVFQILDNALQISFDKSINIDNLINTVKNCPIKDGVKYIYVEE